MVFREAEKEELITLFEQGYKEWSKGRNFEKYCDDNSKEDDYGTRYVLFENDEIVCSTILLTLKDINESKVYGIGSVVTHDNHRGKGYASRLLKKCIEKVYNENVYVFLYSDIDPSFYEKLGFKELPTHLQRKEKSVCMVYCSNKLWDILLKSNIESIPKYF